MTLKTLFYLNELCLVTESINRHKLKQHNSNLFIALLHLTANQYSTFEGCCCCFSSEACLLVICGLTTPLAWERPSRMKFWWGCLQQHVLHWGDWCEVNHLQETKLVQLHTPKTRTTSTIYKDSCSSVLKTTALLSELCGLSVRYGSAN